MKLFQFQPINKNTLQNLVLKKIWASNPKTFNDPFEFVMRANYRVTRDGKVEYLTQDAQTLLNEIKDWASKFGVTCFSECEDDVSQWSHYSSSHTGMCLTFEMANPLPENLFKVNYQLAFPDITENFETDFLEYLITKGKCWRHEKEQRLIFKEGIGHYDYPGILSEITFGCRSSKTDIESVIKICDNIFETEVAISKMSVDPNSFFLSKATIFRKRGDPVPKYWIES